MPALITKPWESSPDAESPPAYGTSRPSLADRPAQSIDGLALDSDASRILIVDDDPFILKLEARMAVSLGYRPTIAEDGIELAIQPRHAGWTSSSASCRRE